ncbi:hypothetical protein NDN08_003960 [Rhodosorus marinus]|uniref:Aminoacetone oxidase family FAD-binding enzyme n=1 Tax=Rhodosorus marinus TaxID=101924 RepID=A0AAV8UGX5_9RHOD|nr:hypothetical protein NDN08_003960 [Rhodosorus marinus]
MMVSFVLNVWDPKRIRSRISAENKVIVVGGGAAGFFAAIECAARGKARVKIVEGGKEFLDKVRISGGGRCNTTHAAFNHETLSGGYPRGRRELRGPFSGFDAADTVEWFKNRGVELKTEEDGRMFPVTDDSSTIVDALVRAARESGVQMTASTKVTDISTGNGKNPFSVVFKSAAGTPVTENCDKVLIATGSSKLGYRWAEQLGHSIISPIPSLFTFKIKDKELHELAGVSVGNTVVNLVLPKGTGRRRQDSGLLQRGPTLITHWGFSGPAILRLSAFGARILKELGYQVGLNIDWYPETSKAKTLDLFEDLRRQRGQKRLVGSASPYRAIPARLWRLLLRRAEVNEKCPWAELKNDGMRKLAKEVHECRFSVEGKGAFKEEFVTSGGIPLKEIDMRTMQSKIVPGLFFAGEICDYDGITGGFNLQGAWTTGFLAGRGMGE